MPFKNITESQKIIRDRGRLEEVIKIFRFGAVGVTATVVHIAVSLTLNLKFGVLPQLSHTFALFIACIVSFLGHHSFSFRSEKSRLLTLPRFLFATILSYACSALVLTFLQHVGTEPGISLTVSALVVPFFSYIINRNWVF